ncbi:MAG: hypothetical protein H7246_11530, partial [Phycisphaerae bacterium]|nr:hypothetical protein [Saprospiraceae bacterium]
NNVRAGFFSNTFNSASETFGLRAETNNPGTGNSTGGYFSAIGAGGTVNRGLFATASGNVTNYGAYTQATSVAGQTAIGLFATATGTGTNLAARFDGRVFANGQVGIGISNPNATLHVNGDFRLGAPGHTYAMGVSTNNDLEFRGDGGEVAMTVTDVNGRVGIGTTSPDSRLHVKGNLTLENSDNTNTFSIRTQTSGDIQFIGNFNGVDNTRLVIRDQDGNVGIGTSSPNGKLHVAGDFRLGVPGHTYAMGVNTTSGDLEFRGDGGELAMFIGDQAGRIGINTTWVPAGYQLAIGGRVICEELRVELASAWGDYVFNDDYNLMPLEELEKSIQANKHLPGIPSAAQIEKEGIAVGDMQTKMMVKIEELTLYMIQLKKENDELKREIILLKQ